MFLIMFFKSSENVFFMFVIMFFRVRDTFLWSPPRGSPQPSLAPRSPAPTPPAIPAVRLTRPPPFTRPPHHPSRPSASASGCLRLLLCDCVFASASALRRRLQRVTVSGSQHPPTTLHHSPDRIDGASSTKPSADCGRKKHLRDGRWKKIIEPLRRTVYKGHPSC